MEIKVTRITVQVLSLLAVIKTQADMTIALTQAMIELRHKKKVIKSVVKTERSEKTWRKHNSATFQNSSYSAVLP